MNSETNSKGKTIFISYAHEDERYRVKFVKHLTPLKNEGLINVWDDRKIPPGGVWPEEIHAQIEKADIILLLVSPDFMASNYINGVEIKRAMELHEDGKTRVIPVILKPSDWTHAIFAKLQVIPADAKPISDWKNRDAAFLNIVEYLRKIVEETSTGVRPNTDIGGRLDTATNPNLQVRKIEGETGTGLPSSVPSSGNDTYTNIFTQTPPPIGRWNVSIQPQFGSPTPAIFEFNAQGFFSGQIITSFGNKYVQGQWGAQGQVLNLQGVETYGYITNLYLAQVTFYQVSESRLEGTSLIGEKITFARIS